MRVRGSLSNTNLNCVGHQLSIFHGHGVDDHAVPDMQVAWRCRRIVLAKLRVGTDHHFDGSLHAGFNGDGLLRYLDRCSHHVLFIPGSKTGVDITAMQSKATMVRIMLSLLLSDCVN
jgi:hypothetical protein